MPTTEPIVKSSDKTPRPDNPLSEVLSRADSNMDPAKTVYDLGAQIGQTPLPKKSEPNLPERLHALTQYVLQMHFSNDRLHIIAESLGLPIEKEPLADIRCDGSIPERLACLQEVLESLERTNNRYIDAITRYVGA